MYIRRNNTSYKLKNNKNNKNGDDVHVRKLEN